MFDIRELAQGYENAKKRFRRHSTLQITDNKEIIADGCEKIINCDDNVIVIEQTSNRLTITGSDLKLRNWGVDGVTIFGRINSIEFEENK